MKRRGGEPVTRSDLWALQKEVQALGKATQEDIRSLRTSTKEDIQALRTSTKEDIQSLRTSTKEDIQSLRSSTQGDTQTLGASLESLAEATRKEFQAHARVLKNIAVEVSGLKAASRELREDFSSAFSRLESRLIGRIDGFMAKTEKVDRDQLWLVHRMDKIEERVSRIEKRAA